MRRNKLSQPPGSGIVGQTSVFEFTQLEFGAEGKFGRAEVETSDWIIHIEAVKLISGDV